MKDIGLTISIPVGAVSESGLELSVRPVAYGNIEMPKDCVAHGPLYVIAPHQMQKEIKIVIEHSCNIESEDDCKNMVVLGLDSRQQSDNTYRLTEIEGAKTNFRIGEQKADITLKELQSLRIGRKLSSSDSPSKGNNDRSSMYRTYIRT